MSQPPTRFDWSALPVIQAPMAGSQGHALAAAVCNAGGLGSLPAALLSPEQLESELRSLRAATSHPFNVNFFCHVPPQPEPARERAWRELLAPYYAELGLDAGTIPGLPQRKPFSDAALAVLEQFRPAVVSFHFGLPEPRLLQRVRELGCRVLSSATTVAEGQWLAARGVDAVIAQGVEAGGHRGLFLDGDLSTQVDTLTLVRGLAATVNVPVIAAGGIATAEQAATARAAGAAAVQAGSVFLLCPEATTSPVHRAALASAGAVHTAITNLFTGRPARGIVNRLMTELTPMNPLAPPFPLAATAVAPLRAAAELLGRGDFSPLWCGTRAGQYRAAPAADVTRALAAGA